MTNQQFCYWLQGYFEISRGLYFTETIATKIEKQLARIQEPLGLYTQWLHDTLLFLKSQQYKPGFLALFFPQIEARLQLVFLHVIDNSYERTVTMEAAIKIHQGKMHDE